ncbi:MAG TPA: DUF2878 domain-containing protein [Cellvibrionaceae bacterium]
MFNVVMFQVGWLICVLAGSIVALVFTLAVSAVHFSLIDNRRADLLMASVALAMGLIHDNAIMLSGIVDYHSVWAPVWILCLWWLMGLTLRHSLAFVYQRLWLSAPLGAFAAALAYLGGVRLSEASWVIEPMWGVLIIAIIWLGVLPLHRYLIHSISRVSHATT